MKLLPLRLLMAVPAVAVLFVILCAPAVLAQEPPSPPADADPGAPRVTSMNGRLELGYDVSVGVSNLAAWAANNDANKLVPFLNGRAIRGNYPIEVHTAAEHVHFQLAITPDNRDVWIDLLGAPAGLRTPAVFTVGLEGQTPFPTDFEHDRSPLLTVISPVYGVVAAVLVLAALLAFLGLARKTDLLRDSGPGPGPGKLKRYNLGRAQMAFWFFLTYVSYVVIWLITDAIDTITPALLGLMGISAGTALSEVLIDANKDSASTARLRAATAEKQALDQSIGELQSQAATLASRPAPSADDNAARDSLNRQLLDQRTRLNQLVLELRDLGPAAGTAESCGFLQDVLKDGNGYSFHRFQIFAWTIALGMVFVSAVYNNLAMPEFSATMLGLMGMSSGTYIGFKFPEQR